jgi:hypothetical protein
VTLSFSIEDRDASGRKKSAFYSVTTSRGTTEGQTLGWDAKEVQVVRCLISKHVVNATYHDAVRRGIVSGKTATEEVKAIFEAYDASIAKILGDTDDAGTG